MATAPDEATRDYRNSLVKQAAESHEPVRITGENEEAVLIAEEDWRAVQETLYLLSIPGMRESIREGLATPVEACSKGLRILYRT
jgi:antitoxin YefM